MFFSLKDRGDMANPPPPTPPPPPPRQPRLPRLLLRPHRTAAPSAGPRGCRRAAPVAETCAGSELWPPAVQAAMVYNWPSQDVDAIVVTDGR